MDKALKKNAIYIQKSSILFCILFFCTSKAHRQELNNFWATFINPSQICQVTHAT